MNKFKINQELYFMRSEDRKGYKGCPIAVLNEKEVIYYLFEMMSPEGQAQVKVPESYCFKSKEELNAKKDKVLSFWEKTDKINADAHAKYLRVANKFFGKLIPRPELAMSIDNAKEIKEIQRESAGLELVSDE